MPKKQPAKIVNFSGYTGGFDVNKTKVSSKKTTRSKKNEKRKIDNFETKKFNIAPILFIILIAGLVYGCLKAPMFNVKKILVDNNLVYTDNEIIVMSRLAMNKNIFLQNTNLAIESIKKAPYTADVKVVRKFPNIMKIILTEREKKAYIDYVGVYAIIDANGMILEEVNKNEASDILPIVKGVLPKDIIKGFELGKRIEADEDLKIQRLLNVLDLMEKNEIIFNINEINVTNKDEILITIEDGAKVINFGDLSNMNIKIKYLEKILESNIGKKGLILMNSNENNLKPIFKETIGGKI